METLKLNISHPDVLFLQAYLGLSPDGSFGPKTEEAVKNFQKSHGLVPDGVVGKGTWEKLGEVYPKEKASDADYKRICQKIGLKEVALLKAFKEVESSGKAWLPSGKPQILFEGHIFWQELKKLGIDPAKHSCPGILYKSWTKAYYKGGESEYSRLEKAWKISPKAALKSASSGLFQIMGNNYLMCGASSVQEFWASCFISEVKQLEYVGNFLKKRGIVDALNAHLWGKAANAYNGPGYKANKYDIKLKNAYGKHSK